MKEQKIIIGCIVFVVILGIVLGALRPKEVLPYQQINTALDSLKQSCNSVCDTGNQNTISITLPPRTNGYTTKEAICFTQDEKLYCTTCSCTLVDASLFNTTINTTNSETNGGTNKLCTTNTESPGVLKVECQ